MSNQSKARQGGVLPINAVATKKSNTSTKSSQRSPAPKLRLIIRRLPPGLTEAEFWDVMGSEWQSGNGKVEWHAFKEGKISRDLSKPSRPGRAYIKVKDQSVLESLSVKVKSSAFKDAKNTGSDSCLVGPPSLEYAPYNKIPSGRNRHDGRQGTIDQDQEFIDFLQSLTEPITKFIVNGADIPESKPEKVATTPLVQFIKDKKANKAKEKEAATAAKISKKNQEAKEGKAKGESRPTVVVKSNSSAGDKARVAKAAQEVVKAANKSAAQIQNKTASNKLESKATKEVSALTSNPTPATNATPSKPERQRGNASAASRLIARDLGLTPKEPRTTRAARNVSAAAATVPEATKSEPQPKQAALSTELISKPPINPVATTVSPTSTPKPAVTAAPTPPTGPRNNKSNQPAQPKSIPPTPPRPAKALPQPSAGAKSAFLKHANPSQGVTEELLRVTFSVFGEMSRCEIDKKKGLGYIDFTDAESLKKAMAASPVKVGNGQVVVLQNKCPYKKGQIQSTNTAEPQSSVITSKKGFPTTSSAVPSAVTSPQLAPATMVAAGAIVTNAPTTSTNPERKLGAEATKLPNAPAEGSAPPTSPKAAKGGNNAARGVRGGNGPAGGRGNFNHNPNRGRGGFRGRGNRGGRGGADADGSAATSTATATKAPPNTQQGGNESAKTTTTEST